MGVINHDCIIATTWCKESMERLIASAKNWGIEPLIVTPPNQFGYLTALLPPDGSKEGWSDSNNGDTMRNSFIFLLETFNYEDDSNPFSWVEVSYGEKGQRVTQGNNKDVY